VVVESGEAAAEVSAEDLLDAIEAIKDGEGGDSEGDAEVVVNIDFGEDGSDIDAISLTLPADAFQTLADDTDAALTIASPLVTITFDNDALATIAEAGTGAVTITASLVSGADIPDGYKNNVGGRPVFKLVVKKGETIVSEFDGNATVYIPYKLGSGEYSSAVVVYHIDDDGKVSVCNATYNTTRKSVVLVTTHFSVFAVGYNFISFADVSQMHPNFNAITFLAARGILGGDGAGELDSTGSISRLEMLVMIMLILGYTEEDAAAYDGGDDFTDAERGSRAYGWLGMAKRDGIAKGDGNNRFSGDRPVTQQEVLVALSRALIRNRWKVPAEQDRLEIEDVVGESGFSDWVDKDDGYGIVKSILLSGSVVSNNVEPTGMYNRGQTSQLVYNLMRQ
jgi:hypothetical protein